MKFSFLVLQIIVKVGGISTFVIYVPVNFKHGKYTRTMFFQSLTQPVTQVPLSVQV